MDTIRVTKRHYLSDIIYLLFIYLNIVLWTTHLLFCTLPMSGLKHIYYQATDLQVHPE